MTTQIKRLPKKPAPRGQDSEVKITETIVKKLIHENKEWLKEMAAK